MATRKGYKKGNRGGGAPRYLRITEKEIRDVAEQIRNYAGQKRRSGKEGVLTQNTPGLLRGRTVDDGKLGEQA